MHLRDEPPKHLTLKINRVQVPRPTNYSNLINSSSRVHMLRFTHPRAQFKGGQLHPDLNSKVAHLLIEKCWPEGQPSNLTHTSRSLLEHSLGMKTSRYHLHALPLLCSRAPVFPGRELLYSSGTLTLYGS